MKQCLLRLPPEDPSTGERIWDRDGIPVLRAAFSMPAPTGTDPASRRIRLCCRLQSRAFLRYCERVLLPRAEAEYRAALEFSAPLPFLQAELSHTITFNDFGLYSLHTESREWGLPGVPVFRLCHGDSWDLAAACPAPLQCFFPRRSGWKKRLLRQIAAEMEAAERAGVSQWRANWRQQLRRCFDPKNFYLSDAGLTVFYPMYALGPAAEGIPAFTIPYGGDGPFPRPDCFRASGSSEELPQGPL